MQISPPVSKHYPKNGPMQQLDIEDNVVVDLVRQYVEEKEKGLLTVVEIEPASLWAYIHEACELARCEEKAKRNMVAEK